MNKKDFINSLNDVSKPFNLKLFLEFSGQVYAEPTSTGNIKVATLRPRPNREPKPRTISQPVDIKQPVERSKVDIEIIDDQPVNKPETIKSPQSTTRNSNPTSSVPSKMPSLGSLPSTYSNALDSALDANMVLGKIPEPQEVTKLGGSIVHGGNFLDSVPEIYRTAQPEHDGSVSFDPNYFVGTAARRSRLKVIEPSKSTVDIKPASDFSTKASDSVLSKKITSVGLEKLAPTNTNTNILTATKNAVGIGLATKLLTKLATATKTGTKISKLTRVLRRFKKSESGGEPSAPPTPKPREGFLGSVRMVGSGIENTNFISPGGQYTTNNALYSGSQVNPYISALLARKSSENED